MKHLHWIIMAVIFIAGCTSMKFWIPSYTIDEVVAQKKAIESTENPAKSMLLLKELERKRVIIKQATVKQVTSSINIDYTFSVIATVECSSEIIECYIYARNWRNQEDYETVAKLRPGDTIYVIGRFSRFLKLLGQQYAVEIVEATVSKIK